MGNNGLVSIIIPVHNVAPYLKATLDSVIYQTYKRLEIIIIDDGSTDGSGIICDDYAAKDDRLRVVHQENKGVSEARNVGLNMMTGDAVAFLDSDDVFHPNFVRTMIDTMEKNKADIVLCKYIRHEANQAMNLPNEATVSPLIKQGGYNRSSALNALADGSINHAVWNKLYNCRLWEDIRFPIGSLYEDINTFFRIVDRCSSIYVIDDPLYFYRKRPGSITNSVSSKKANDWLNATSYFKSYMLANIPTIFSQRQYDDYSHMRIKRMISYYVQLSRNGDNNDKKYLKILKNEIVISVNDVGLDGCSFYIKACYGMIRSIPQLLSICYPVYHAIRCFVVKCGLNWKH